MSNAWRVPRIVVADNDPAVVELVATDLGAEGYDVVEATDGDEALERCRETTTDLLVIDYRMPPGPNGIETGRQARAEWPEMPMILFTNYQAGDLRARASDAGMVVVDKGNIRVLRRTVAELIRSTATPEL